MADMRLIVAGAGGRMGRALVRVISETPGAVLAGALEAPGSELLGKDAGVLAGLPENGVKLSADLWALSANADGILDFTVPGRHHRQCRNRRRARAGAHVIGTTGLSASDDGRHQERHLARDRGAVRQYEPRRQPAGGAGEARRAIARREFRYRNSRNASQGQDRRAVGHGLDAGRGCRRRPRRRSAIPIRRVAATARPERAVPATSALPRCAAAPSPAITA